MNIENTIKEMDPIVKQSQDIVISSEEDKANASKLLSSITSYSTLLEADKDKLIKPLNETLKAVRAKYKPLETILGTSTSILRNKIGQYQTEQLKISALEAEKIANRVGEGRGFLKAETAMNKIANIDKPDKVVITDNGNVGFRTDRVLKVTDVNAIPREYFDLNETRLIKALKDNAIIAGATLENKQTVIIKC